MKNNQTSDDSVSTALGWKFIIIVAAITTIFFTFLYLAMSSKPDYMIKPNETTQHNPPTNESPQVDKNTSK